MLGACSFAKWYAVRWNVCRPYGVHHTVHTSGLPVHPGYIRGRGTDLMYPLGRVPTERFWGEESSKTNIRVQFYQQHPRYSIVIMEEVNQPHPHCPQRDMFSLQEALNLAHPTATICRCGLERKQQRMVVSDTE